MVQTKDQYVLVHQAVKELFSDQLRMIETHPYENVDLNGEPLLGLGHTLGVGVGGAPTVAAPVPVQTGSGRLLPATPVNPNVRALTRVRSSLSSSASSLTSSPETSPFQDGKQPDCDKGQ